MSALCLLKKLEVRGISFSKRKNHQLDQGSDVNIRSLTCSGGSDYVAGKKHKTTQLQPNIPSDQLNGESTEKDGDSKDIDIPVFPPIKMKKGGPWTHFTTSARNFNGHCLLLTPWSKNQGLPFSLVTSKASIIMSQKSVSLFQISA